jgi:hypothetical protein
LEAGHCHIAESCGSFCFLEINEMCVLVDLVKVHLVEIADAGEDHAVTEFAYIVEMLLENWWVRFLWEFVGFVFW